MIIPRGAVEAALHERAAKIVAQAAASGPQRFANGGPVRGGLTVWLNEYSEMRAAPARRTVVSHLQPSAPSAGDVWIDPVTGEAMVYHVPGVVVCMHPNPEPVILTTDEVVAAVCPDCLHPLPPSAVGSEWKP